MTSSSRRVLAVLAALLAVLAADAAWAEHVFHRGDTAVGGSRRVDDVVVADGQLRIEGRVRGSVFVVRGSMIVERGGVVRGNVTVLGGNLTVRRGGRLEGEADVLAGRLEVDSGGYAPQAREVDAPDLTEERLEVISRYIIFDRSVPHDDYPLAGLAGIRLAAAELEQISSGPASALELFGLGSASFSPDDLDDSIEVVYRDHDLTLTVTAVRFKGAGRAEGFWEALRTEFEDVVAYSVHNSLGDGAHWFFRHQGGTYCLWRNERTLMAVVVKHDYDGELGHHTWRRLESLRDETIIRLRERWSQSERDAREHKRQRRISWLSFGEW